MLASGAYDSVRAKPKPPVRDSILKWAKALGCPGTTSSTSDGSSSRNTRDPLIRMLPNKTLQRTRTNRADEVGR